MPYNPAATFDPSLITRTGSVISGAITDAGQHFAQIKKQDKAAKALYDALEPEEDGQTGALRAHPLGLTRDAFNSLSSQDRIAKISGFVEAEALKSARRKEQMATQEMQLRAEELGLRRNESSARLAALTQEQGADNALAAVLKSAHSPAINTPGPFGGPVAPGGVTPDRLLQALAQNPQAINARGMSNVDNLMRALNTSGEQTFFQPNDTNFALPNVPGMLRVPTGPNTAVILADPTKAGQTVAITGPNGEQMGFGLPTRSGVTPLNTGSVKDKDRYTRLTKQLTGLIAAQGKAFRPETIAEYQKQISAVESELEAIEGGQPTSIGRETAGNANPQQSDIEYLKANPNLKAAFEKRFGKGSAAKYLN